MKWMRLLAILSVVSLGSLATVACGDDDPPTEPPQVTAPSAPTGVTATASGTTITVAWTAVSGADSYDVSLSTPGESARSESTTGTSVDFSGLTPGATYAATVTATNTAGSATSTAATAQIAEEEPDFVVIENDILEDVTWTADKTYVLRQPTFVGRDCGTDGSDPDCVEATLTIEPGTTVVGRTNLPQGVRGAYLVVSRGSQIIADATGEDRPPTADEVIVFTSDNPRGQRDRGDWGGLIINGQAQTNAGAEAQGEGDSGLFGGMDDMDSSGILRGVRIEFAGDRVTPSDELNGLALQGVGAGTTLSYIQIHYNVDDGIEPFGGTVSVDHLVVTGIGDDSVDGTDGYRGFMQFIVGQQRGDEADNGMELSNDGEDADAMPYSTAVIANATMIGGDEDVQSGEIGGPNGDRGIEFREATHYRVYNSILRDFGNAGVCVGEGQTVVNANNRLSGETNPQTTLDIQGSIVWNNAEAGDSMENFEECGGFTTQENMDFFLTDGWNNMVTDPLLDPSYNMYGELSAPPAIIATAAPDGYTAFDLSTIPFDGVNLFAPTDGRTLVATDYPGAVEPGTALADAWYNGWTIWSIDGADSRPNSAGN